jgi:hypothetical protein
LQGKGDTSVGTLDSATGFTILSEKKLFLGQKVSNIMLYIVQMLENSSSFNVQIQALLCINVFGQQL